MFAYVGCYTTPDRDGRGDGIRVYRLNDAGDIGQRSITFPAWKILRCLRCAATGQCCIPCMGAEISSARSRWTEATAD